MEEYLEAMAEEMNTALEHLKRELGSVRTGRASPKLVENVQVNVHSYGAVMPINQLATIQAPDARLITILPWDKGTLSDIEKGIIAAGLGLNPSNDGQIIRVPVPPLTKERRQDIVKQVRKYGEESKVRLRQIRREYNDTFKEAEKDGEVSEDEGRRLLTKVQDATDKAVKAVDDLVTAKEAEVLEV